MLGDMMREMELLYAQAYTRGHRTDAMNRCACPTRASIDVEVPAFQFGITLGLTLTALAIAIYIFALMESEKPPFYTEMFIMYRGFFMAIMLVWFWGLNMYLWERTASTTRSFSSSTARAHQAHHDLARGVDLLVGVGALRHALGARGRRAARFRVAHGGAAIRTAARHAALVCDRLSPCTAFARGIGSMRSLARIISPHPFVACQIPRLLRRRAARSVSRPRMMDAEFIVCFYVNDVAADFRSLRAGDQGSCLASESWTRPLIASLPSLWRIGQCCRRYYDERERWHIIDAARHATALFVIGFAVVSDSSSAYMALWITAVVLAVLVNFAWDVLRDWGLFDFDTELGRRTFVSTRSALYPRWWLYVGFASDLALRVAWALTLSPSAFGVEVITLLAFVEILRRAQWNMHRMANEQQSNIGKFRAIAFVPVPIANHGH
jgi:hypothetical protein